MDAAPATSELPAWLPPLPPPPQTSPLPALAPPLLPAEAPQAWTAASVLSAVLTVLALAIGSAHILRSRLSTGTIHTGRHLTLTNTHLLSQSASCGA